MASDDLPVRAPIPTKSICGTVPFSFSNFKFMNFHKRICRQSSKFFKLIFLEKFTEMSYY